MPKNIVVCCDGTGNKFCVKNSNVVKLYTCLSVKKEQVAYYHPGVGTLGNQNRVSALGREFSRFTGLALASGFLDNLADAYKYLMNKYEDGDRIYLFGFSRGAYTVRALGGALYMYGLLCPGNEGHLPYLLQMFSSESRRAYKREKVQGGRKLNTNKESEAFRDTFSRVVPIHFMGVWDTVSSIGWIYDPVKMLYDGQNPMLRKGRHAMSVDERRCFYQANPWGPPLPAHDLIDLRRTTGDPMLRQDIVQAWFAGVHSDVGGSYAQEQSGPAMQALQWILEEAEADGLLIHDEKRNAIFGRPSDTFPALSHWNRETNPHHCLHKSLVWGWLLLEVFPHKYFDQAGKLRWRITPWPRRRDVPYGALIHPSLRARLSVKHLRYSPKNLPAEHIVDFSKTRITFPHSDVTERLKAQNFGVYRPPSADGPALNLPVRAAAAVLIGVAALMVSWWMF